MIQHFWPILMVVLANVVYNISAKSTPSAVNAFLSLTVTYFVAAVCSILLYLTQGEHQKIVNDLAQLNWTSLTLGVSVVALEFSYIAVYRAGWNVNTASLIANILLACVLIVVGSLMYNETLTLKQLIGIAICAVGLIFIK